MFGKTVAELLTIDYNIDIEQTFYIVISEDVCSG